MARRIRPFEDCIFRVVVSVPNELTGQDDEHVFHQRGISNTWDKLVATQEHLGIGVDPDFTDQNNWTLATVVDIDLTPMGTARRRYTRTLSDHTITAERVLTIEESVPHAIYNLTYKDHLGRQLLERFSEQDLGTDVSLNVTANVGTAQEFVVLVHCKRANVQEITSEMGAQVSWTEDVGVTWQATANVAVVVV